MSRATDGSLLIVRQSDDLDELVSRIRRCSLCEGLPFGPKPILQVSPSARILIAGQAPGKRAHRSGRPFDDASGDRLRAWLGVDRATFYESGLFAVVPMGFCFPGSDSRGDRPPRSECAPTWRAAVLSRLPHIALTLVVGRHAQNWHLEDSAESSVTAAVRNWRQRWPHIVPLPHPSPRNRVWFARNPAFETELLPLLRARVRELLAQPGATDTKPR